MSKEKEEVFKIESVPKALAVMALPTVFSQVIVLAYNIADTWFIGRTDNPFMIGAASLVLALFLSLAALANLFGVGGGNLMVRQMGSGDMEGAKKTASHSLAMAGITALGFSVICLILMNPILDLLGASENTMDYARQYFIFTVVLGGVPTVLSLAMPMLLRNAGFAKEAGFGVALGGILNIALDPLFMFVILPDGYQVLGAAIATFLSNVISMIYFIIIYVKYKNRSVLVLPKKIEKITKEAKKALYSVGIPAALILLMFDIVNIVLNKLAASYSDIELASVGIVLKVERFPINIGLGICLGMVPLIAFNFAKKDFKRMDKFFSAAGIAIISVSVLSLIVFFFFAEEIVNIFIEDKETVRIGAMFLKARCFAAPFMMIGFQAVNFMQAVGQGKYSLLLSAIRHIALNIPAMLIFNAIWGLDGLIMAQTVSDIINAVITVIIYRSVHKKLTSSVDLSATSML